MIKRRSETSGETLKVGIGGLGAIGLKVARVLDEGGIPGLELAAISAQDTEKARHNMSDFKTNVPVVALSELAGISDVVVECAPSAVFRDVAVPTLEAGLIFVPISVGCILQYDDLVGLANSTHARIIIPTGALIALDAVRAAAEGEITSVTMVTRKPPAGFVGAPYVVEHNIDINAITEPTKIFDGSARDGARGFPANVNVAAALSLAGIGPDRTKLEIWADPTVDRNIQHFKVDADSASFEATIKNIPSEENIRTGKITALSVIAALRGLTASFKVGS
jgi:aspartate dehydrogenase